MEQRIIKAFPPNYVELRRTFPCSQDTIFSWGDIIYRPNGQAIPQEILVHEGVHGERQMAMGIEAWWRRYIDESAFRFEEELVAHRAEYLAYRTKSVPLPSRSAEERRLDLIARRLSGPLYGGLISLQRAKDMIR